MEERTSVRILGKLLDGLIRSVRSRMPATAAIAERGHSTWQQHGDAVLELDATELHVDGELVLTANADEGRWLLPAFMAGLRQIRMLDYASPSDLLRLCTELSTLESTLASITRFRDWLWADGAEGFEVTIDDSFAEDAEVAFLDFEEQREQLLLTRMMVAESLCVEHHRISAKELDAAAHREEFEVPLEAYARHGGEGAIDLGEAELERLRDRCNECIAWGDGQVYLALAYPALQGALAPDVLASRLTRLARRRADARFLGLLSNIVERTDQASEDLLGELQAAGVGEVLGAGLPAEPATLSALTRLASMRYTKLCGTLLGQLLQRCHSDREYTKVIATVLSAIGPEKFCRALTLEELSPEGAFVLVRLLVYFKAPAACFAGLLPSLPPDSALRFMVELPTNRLVAAASAVEDLMCGAPADSTARAIEKLLERRERPLTELVGKVFGRTTSSPWNRTLIGKVLAALAKDGLAIPYLVPLVRNPDEQDFVRIAAIRLMDGDPAAQALAVRRSIKGAFGSPGVRACMRDARRRLGEQHDG